MPICLSFIQSSFGADVNRPDKQIFLRGVWKSIPTTILAGLDSSTVGSGCRSDEYFAGMNGGSRESPIHR